MTNQPSVILEMLCCCATLEWLTSLLFEKPKPSPMVIFMSIASSGSSMNIGCFITSIVVCFSTFPITTPWNDCANPRAVQAPFVAGISSLWTSGLL